MAIAAVALVAASVPVACASILGIDNGVPDADASATDSTVDGSKDAGDAAHAEGGGADGPCVSDPNWCVTHCLNSTDTCGLARNCPDCTGGLLCVSQTHVCTCVRDPNWCMGRCGNTKDNCGQSEMCPDCDGGVMCNANNSCGDCDASNGACSGKSCGAAVNGCNQLIGCGFNGTEQCPVMGDVCDAGQCCHPDFVTPCLGKCSGEPETTCGLPFNCISCADGGLTCLNGQCCNQAACGGPCMNQCGSADPNCCPPDAGDGGIGCGMPNSVCTMTPCCQGLYCERTGGTCGMGFCLPEGGPCDASSQCCYGLTCMAGMDPRAPLVEASLGNSFCQ